MRKVVLWVLVLVLIAGGAVAYAAPSQWGEYQGNPVVRLVVGDKPIEPDVPAIALDGRTLVPLRVVTEALGGSVAWDQDNFSVRVTPPAPPAPAPGFGGVLGPKDFRDTVNLALLTLLAKDREDWNLVIDNVTGIVLGAKTECLPRSGTVSISPFGASDTTWLAAALVHEATHVADFRSGLWAAPAATKEADIAEEEKALQAERRTLVKLGASAALLKLTDAAIQARLPATADYWTEGTGGP